MCKDQTAQVGAIIAANQTCYSHISIYNLTYIIAMNGQRYA